MGAFTPFKRHANSFNYKPRHYDPKKEAMEQRRVELRGFRRDSKEVENDHESGYQPGQYIRAQSAARSARRSVERKSGAKSKLRMYIMIAVVAALGVMGSMLYNKLVEMVNRPTIQQSIKSQAESEYEEFNPHTPITIVPNDYVEPTK